MDQFSDDLPQSISGTEDAQDRAAARDSLFLMSDLRIGDDIETVRVRNLSAGGMMAEYPRGLNEGAVVDCVLRGIGTVRGRVAWCAAGRIGIAFDCEIDPKLARKPVATVTKTTSFATPKYTPRHR